MLWKHVAFPYRITWYSFVLMLQGWPQDQSGVPVPGEALVTSHISTATRTSTAPQLPQLPQLHSSTASTASPAPQLPQLPQLHSYHSSTASTASPAPQLPQLHSSTATIVSTAPQLQSFMATTIPSKGLHTTSSRRDAVTLSFHLLLIQLGNISFSSPLKKYKLSTQNLYSILSLCPTRH